MTARKRLAQLERLRTEQGTQNGFAQVVIYEPSTGAPLAPVQSNTVTIWIPDNKRQ